MTWADSNYSYRKEITITENSSTTLSNYQVKLTVNYVSGHMQTDFSDLKFYDSDDSTELSYWIESYTSSTSAIVWVKVPSISSGTSSKKIYMYYGYGSSNDLSDGDNTFIFFDDVSTNKISTTATCNYIDYKYASIGTTLTDNFAVECSQYVVSRTYASYGADITVIGVGDSSTFSTYNAEDSFSHHNAARTNSDNLLKVRDGSNVSVSADFAESTVGDWEKVVIRKHGTTYYDQVWNSSGSSLGSTSVTKSISITMDKIFMSTYRCDGSNVCTLTYSDANDYYELYASSGGGGGPITIRVKDIFVRNCVSSEPTSAFGSEETNSSATEYSKTYTIDSLISKEFSKSYTTDAIILKEQSKSFIADALLSKEQSKQFTADTLLRDELTTHYNVDTLLQKEFDKTYTTDTILEKEFSKNYTTDTYIKKLDIPKTYTINTILKSEGSNAYTIDTLLQDEFSESYTTDTILKQEFSQSYTVDTTLLKEQSKQFTTDILLRDELTTQYNVDTLLQKEISKNYSADTLLVGETSKQYTADVLLSKQMFTDINIDLYLSKEFEKDYTVDTIIKHEFDKTYLNDILIKKSLEKTYQSDILLRDELSKQYNVDILLQDEFSKSYTTDTIIKKQFSKEYAVDIILHQPEEFDIYILINNTSRLNLINNTSRLIIEN